MYSSDQNQEWRKVEQEYTPLPRNGPSLRRSASANQSHWEQSYNQQQQPSSRCIQPYNFDNNNYRHLSYAEINNGYHQPQSHQQRVVDWSDTDRTLPRVNHSKLSSDSFTNYNVQHADDIQIYAEQHRQFPSSQSLTADQNKKNIKSRGLSRVRSFLGFTSSANNELPSYEQSTSKRKPSGLGRRRKHSTVDKSQLTPPLQKTPPPSRNWSPRLDTCYETQSQCRTRQNSKPVRPTSFNHRLGSFPSPSLSNLSNVPSSHQPSPHTTPYYNDISQPSTPYPSRIPPAYPGRSSSFNEHDLNRPKQSFQVYQNKKIAQISSIASGRQSTSRTSPTSSTDPSSSSCEQDQGELVHCFKIIERDKQGFGLTVSGDNPVFVEIVKKDGAAFRAGVEKGDRIIKVNGTLVTSFNHIEVCRLIKC